MKIKKFFFFGFFLVTFWKSVQCQFFHTNINKFRNFDLKWVELSESNKIHTFLCQVVAQFSSLSNIVFHYDYDSGKLVDTVIKGANQIMTESKSTTEWGYTKDALTFFTINYSALNQSFMKYNNQHNQRINMIFLTDPREFELFNEHIIRHEDIVVYFYCKHYMKPDIISLLDDENGALNTKMFFKRDFIREVHSVFVVEIEDNFLKLHDICYYCGENSKKIILIGQKFVTSTSQDDDVLLNTLKNVTENRFSNFYGHVFRIAFVFGNVSLTCEHIQESVFDNELHTQCSGIGGVEGRLLIELQRKLNFEYQLVTPKHEEKGAWKNMILDVNMSRADWAMGGITISESRYKKVTFSSSFGNDPMRILFADQESVFAEGVKVIFAFGLYIWLILGLTLITLSAVLYTWNKYLSSEELVNFSESIWIIFSILIEQCFYHIHIIGGRKVMLMWLLCCVIISTSYKGKLYVLMVSTPTDSIIKIEQLVDQGYEALLHQADSSLMETMMKTSSDPILVKLSEKTRDDYGLCDGVKALLENKMLILEEQNIIVYSFNKECAHRLSAKELSRFRLSPDILLTSSHGWPFRKKTPYLKLIDEYIQRIYATGLYNKWREIAMNFGGNDVLSSDGIVFPDTNKVFKLKSFLGLLILWCIGIIVSLLAISMEIIVAKILRKKQRRNTKFIDNSIQLTFIN